MRTAALERVVQRAGARRGEPRGEPCALCAAELPGDHAHLLEVVAARPLCVCQACSLLFDSAAASEGRYLAIPDRRVRLEGVVPADLRVPVGLAFFVLDRGGQARAHYPSPAGATRWEVDPADWEAAVEACPALAGLAPEVEALLVNTARGASEAWIVPVTDCYRIVGVVRQHWEGLNGGARVWQAIDELFDELRRNDGHHPRR